MGDHFTFKNFVKIIIQKAVTNTCISLKKCGVCMHTSRTLKDVIVSNELPIVFFFTCINSAINIIQKEVTNTSKKLYNSSDKQ